MGKTKSFKGLGKIFYLTKELAEMWKLQSKSSLCSCHITDLTEQKSLKDVHL